MRIAVNTRLLLKDRLEGIGRYANETLKRMVLAHPEHEFIFFFDRPYDPQFIYADNVTPVVLFPQARHPFLYYGWFHYSVKKALKKQQADVFLSPDGYLPLGSKIPCIPVIHDLAFLHYPEQIAKLEKWYYTTYFPKYIKQAAKVVTVSNYTKQDINEQYGTDLNNIAVTYNAADDSFKPISDEAANKVKQQYSEGKDYFVYVGAMHPRKNIVRLIEGFSLFKKQTNSEKKLVLVGRYAWQTEDINRAFEQSAYKSDILFTGRVSDEELVELVAAAYSLVYVPYFEGFGIPIVEAFNCEVPVITSNITSMPEVAGEAGLLVDPFSVEDIARGMQAMDNAETHSSLKQEAITRKSAFSWDKSAEQLWQVIEEVYTSSKA